MSYIYRELLSKIESYLSVKQPSGLILSGIVGCGKTTLIEKLLQNLKGSFKILDYSGDDVQFRNAIIDDSKFIFNEVVSKVSGHEKVLVFVDEVQKCEEIFDALKYAFDHRKISFIVSGSNPAFLNTVAKKRLQRRAEQFFMLPLALSEVAIHNHWIESRFVDSFSEILFHRKTIEEWLPLPEMTLPAALKTTAESFFHYGGLPLAFLASTEEAKLGEIRLVVERGFDLLSTDNNRVAEVVRVELASLHSAEFTYKNIIERTRVRRREEINKNIDLLINHGYLVKKKPILFDAIKSSYLSVFSYIDPGIVTYLSGERPQNFGLHLEGYIHARLAYLIQNSVFKSELHYFKPYTIDINGNIRYQPGEIDFVVTTGKKILPIEVKLNGNIGEIDTKTLERFICDHRLPFGFVLYGGVPYWNKKAKIIFWPYWAV